MKEYKIKITPQRMELIKKLKELENNHPSFNEVYKAMKKTYSNISRSTVHENLKLMDRVGIIQSFYYKGETRYEMNKEPHVNLVKADGSIKDIKNDKITSYLKDLENTIKEDERVDIKKILVIIE